MATYGYLLPTRGIVQSGEDAQSIAAGAEADVVGLARRAEALGFEGVWVGDSVLAKPRLEPLTTLAAVASATDAVDLGTAVYLPHLRHAVHVAHLTATVDQLGGGRLALGVGVGIGPDVAAEHTNLDVAYGRRGRRLDELLDVVRALWTGEPVDHNGDAFELDDASIGFEPVREPPLYVASAAFDPGEEVPNPIAARIVEHGDGWLPIASSPEAYAAGLAEIRQRLDAAGRDPGAIDPAYYVDVVIDENEDVALETARRFYDAYYPAWDTLSDEDIRARGAFGPAAEVAQTLADYADAGVETFVVRFTARQQRAQLRWFVDAID